MIYSEEYLFASFQYRRIHNHGKNSHGTKNQNAKTLIGNVLAFWLVPRAGIEPARICIHWCLRPARLPIPPSGHRS
jgi:hypothetical protein